MKFPAEAALLHINYIGRKIKLLFTLDTDMANVFFYFNYAILYREGVHFC